MKQKSIKKNVLLNVIKQSMSILFPLITYPYVSRVLGAGNLGRYSFSDSIVQIIITISLIGIPTYAVREGSMIRNKAKEINDFCSEVFTINCISALLSYILLFIMVVSVERIRVEQVLIFILSINIFSRCLGRDWLNSIFEEYFYISIRFIVVHLIALVLILLLVKKPDDLVKYVVIMALSEFIGNILNIYYTCRKIPYRLKISKNLLRHMKPVFILFCSSIASTIYIRSDITILGFLRPENDVGIYTIASKIYTIVKNVLNAVITTVIPRLSFYLGNKRTGGIEKYNGLLNNLRNALSLLLFPATVGLFCLSKDAMYILGGNEFQSGGTSLQILCIGMILAVFGCFFAHAVLIVNRQENIFFIATVVSALINISMNFVFIPKFGIDGAAFTTVLSELTIVLICGISARKFFANDKSKMWQYLLPILMECVMIVLISYFLERVIINRMEKIIGTIVLSLLVYLAILVGTKNELLNGMIEKLKNKFVREKR